MPVSAKKEIKKEIKKEKFTFKLSDTPLIMPGVSYGRPFYVVASNPSFEEFNAVAVHKDSGEGIKIKCYPNFETIFPKGCKGVDKYQARYGIGGLRKKYQSFYVQTDEQLLEILESLRQSGFKVAPDNLVKETVLTEKKEEKKEKKAPKKKAKKVPEIKSHDDEDEDEDEDY